MNDDRIWRIKLGDDIGGYWFRYVDDGQNDKTAGRWGRDEKRFTSFTTEEALDVPWASKSEPFPGSGEDWHFEYVGCIIPLADE